MCLIVVKRLAFVKIVDSLGFAVRLKKPFSAENPNLKKWQEKWSNRVGKYIAEILS